MWWLIPCLLLSVALTLQVLSGVARAATEVDYQFSAPIAGAQEEVRDTSGMAARYGFARPEPAEVDDYVSVRMEGTIIFAERAGIPLLPVKTARIAVPYGEEVREIQVIPGQKVVLPGSYRVEFSKTPRPASAAEQNIEDRPDPAIYGSSAPYPGKIFEHVSTQAKQGVRILIVNLYPVQYVPAAGELSYYESMKVVVGTSPSDVPFQTRSLTPANIKGLMKAIDNPAALETYPGVRLDSAGQLKAMEQQAQAHEYVIITSEALEPSFQVLANHKINRGISATVVTTSWIYANYSGTRPDGGSDNQTRIRNFIVDAYNNWGTEYVLLGGDDEIIPHRGCYGYVASLPPESDNDIPTDLYYGCLDGTWDNDADGIYCESNDGAGGGEIDLMSEVHVGRATVDTTAEVDNFVNKTIAYEQAKPPSSGLMTGTQLDSSTWGGDHKDEISAYFPSGWSITTLYDRDGNCSSTTVVNALNSNDHSIMNSAGHGNNGGFSHIDRGHVDGLTNTVYPLVYTWACYTAAFDNRLTSPGNYDPAGDSIAEHFVENDTGAFAYVGNSRYGWYSPGSTGGTSQQFDKEFFDAFFNEGISNLGKILTDSKEDRVGSVGGTGSNRWVYFCLNLLGDPETSLQGEVAPRESVLFFSSSPYPAVAERIRSLGYQVTESTASADLTRTNLRNYDVLWISVNTAPSYYSSQEGEIRSWVGEDRGGLVVEQPNTNGAVTVFPSGFEVTVDDFYYPPGSQYPYYACIDDPTHPLTHGLTDSDLSGTFDSVLDTSIGSDWNILARDCVATDYIALLAGVYGSGRFVFNVHNFSPGSFVPGSDQYLRQMIDWAAGGNKTSVLILAADEASDARTTLAGYPDLGTVNYFDARVGTPSLSQLQHYDVVVTWSNYVYYDPVAMGDVLADYVDTGGKVLTMMFAMGSHGWQMQGRFADEGYSPITGGTIDFSIAELGSYDPGHFLMRGVSAVSDYYRLQDTQLTPGSRWVARWTDGDLLAAVKECGKVAAIAGYIGDYKLWTGDMYTLVHNAIQWLTGKTAVLAVGSDIASSITDILASLKSDPAMGPIHFADAQSGTPPLELLQYYPVVLTWSNYMYNDPVAMGDVLADYVDSGGKALTAMFSMGTHGFAMEGRFMDWNYCPITGSAIDYSYADLGTYDPDHPIMQGVSGVSSFYRLDGSSLSPDSTEVARWTDGDLLVATKNDRSAAAIAAYLGFSWTGDLDIVVRNSINWLGAERPAITEIDFDSSICEMCRADISVNVCDPAGGSLIYTWQALDEGAIVGAGPNVQFDPPNTSPHACPARVKLTVTSSKTGMSSSAILNIYVKTTGDVNGDGNVNVVDKVLVRNAFGQSGPPGWIDADVNCDGNVNVVDKVLVRNHFGEQGCRCRQEFCEDFNDGTADNWQDDGLGNWSVNMVTLDEGVYTLEGTVSGWRSSTYNEIYTDFTFEAELTRSDLETYNTGIMFRSDGTFNNCYHFGIALNGMWLLHKRVGGYTTILSGWNSSPAINTGLGAWNKLKVVCSGPNITLYINDVLVGAFTDTDLSAGKVGVIPYDAFSGELIEYDNICVALDTSLYVPGTTSAVSVSDDSVDPAVAPQYVEPEDRVFLSVEPPEPRPISKEPPATEGY